VVPSFCKADGKIPFAKQSLRPTTTQSSGTNLSATDGLVVGFFWLLTAQQDVRYVLRGRKIVAWLG